LQILRALRRGESAADCPICLDQRLKTRRSL
jgi:hypothetical protein